MALLLQIAHGSQHPGCWRTQTRSKWTPQIQPAHKISQIPCTSHLFLPCWVYKYVGQGTSLGRTRGTEVMAINTGPRLAGVRRGMPQGQGRPGKPHPGASCVQSSVLEMQENRGPRDRYLPKATWTVRV